MTTRNKEKLASKRLLISMSVDDLNAIVMALDFVDFPFHDNKLVEQLRKLKFRLEHLCHNNEIQEIDRITERLRESIKSDLEDLEEKK
jgi:hypothetical protein